MSTPVDFLILGHPRSGTGYMARLFTAFGYTVGHEKVERHGVSSWMFAVHADRVPYTFDGKTRGDIEPRHVFHVVRNPMDVIASMSHTVHEDRAWEFIACYALVCRNAPWHIRAAQSVVAWNRLIQGHFPRPKVVHVENAPAAVHNFLARNGYQPPSLSSVRLPPTNYNSRPHPSVSREQIVAELPTDLADELEHHFQQYEYRQ